MLNDELSYDRNLFYKGNSDKLFMHIPITLPSEDGVLTDEQWRNIAHKFVERLSLHDWKNEVRDRSWVAVRHGLTKNRLDGIHLVISCIDTAGKKSENRWVDDKGKTIFDQAKAQEIARELEIEFGLSELPSYKYNLETSIGYTKADLYQWTDEKIIKLWKYKQMAEKTGLYWNNLSQEQQNKILESSRSQYIPRFEVRHKLLQAKEVAKDEIQFIRLARETGLLLKPRFEKGSNINITGYSVAEKPEFGEKVIWYQARSLDKELALPILRSGWDQGDKPNITKVWQEKKQYFTSFGETSTMKVPQQLIQEMEQTLKTYSAKLKPENHELTPDEINENLIDLSNLFYAWSSKYEHNYPGKLANMGFQLRKLQDRNTYINSIDYVRQSRNAMNNLKNIGLNFMYSKNNQQFFFNSLLSITRNLLYKKKVRQKSEQAHKTLDFLIDQRLQLFDKMLMNQKEINQKLNQQEQIKRTIRQQPNKGLKLTKKN
jgi:hypothetical protein